MKPQARIQACIELLEIIGTSKIPMDSTIGDYMRGRRYIGSKDRAAVVERVYAMMRSYAKLLWWLERMKVEDSPRNFMIAQLVLCEEADEKRIKDLFDASKFSPEELRPDEIELIEKLSGKTLEHPDMPVSVRVECPAEYEEILRNYFGAEFENEMAAMLPPAILDIRVNTFLRSREDVKESLKKDGIESTDTPYSPWGLRVNRKAFLSKTKAFNKGWIDIQDEGSQLIAHVCGVKPGLQVLDYCAGAGGKTLALASAMQRKGRIVAMDTEERRLEKGKARFRKAQVADIIEVRPLSDERHRKWLRRQKETFDVVLLDVPCTGTGTWRRNPDTRWRTYGPGLEDLLKVQREILEKTAICVKKGGRLVYATCSLLPSENEEQVEAFLKDHPEFSVVPPEDEKLGAPYLRLTPLRHATDGFFAAVMVKI